MFADVPFLLAFGDGLVATGLLDRDGGIVLRAVRPSEAQVEDALDALAGR